MARARWVRRNRVGIASGTALALLVGAVAAYAVLAEGYKSHRTDLNDGGIWVVNGDKGIHGRINKPINQLDGVVQDDRDKLRLDVVQDGAAVVAINVGAAQGRTLDTRRLVFTDGATAALPQAGDVQMGGGTLATLDRGSGKVWATRTDPQTGAFLASSVDRQSDPLAEVGRQASLAVSQEGTVVVASAEEGSLSLLRPHVEGFGDPEEGRLPDGAGEVDAVTTVGERVVTLDTAAGIVAVVGGATTSVPPGSALQQPGPSSDTVLVGTPEALVEIDLGDGTSRTVAEAGSRGRAVEPVRLGSCVHGAWSGGRGAVAVACGGGGETVVQALGGNATNLAFRVNRGEIVLNDATSGTVWDVDQDSAIRIDNWNAFTAKKQQPDEDEQEETNAQADRRPPLAKPDSFGARPGRTTVLHPLDNDSAPEGRLLSIVDVSQPGAGASAQISPDGQTIVLTMPERARPVSFDYFIDDGRSTMRADARIDVAVRNEAQNAPPTLRKGYEPRSYAVPSGGSLSVPVLADWRDDTDGDTLLVDSVRALSGADQGVQARTTADGRIRFTAPDPRQQTGAQTVSVEYSVTDGRSPGVRRQVAFDVQSPQSRRAFAATAEPDVVRGEVGTPIKIRPLLNDLPGADPSTPTAELSIGGRIPAQAGLDLDTDLDAGVVTVTAAKAGTYFLDYDAAFGNAPLDKAAIRVDVKPRPRRQLDPVAMPDTLTVYGQSPGLVDVLANDLDPSGGLLVVQRAVPDQAQQLDVAIVDGRWLRVSARQPDVASGTQRIEYVVSNGTNSAVRGEVVVTQRPLPEDDTPVTVTDRVVVRAGASVTVPVLDNDVSPSGDRLSLVGDVAEGTAGELRVVPPLDVTTDPGRAFVSGRVVRYVAPRTLEERDTYEVPYVAVNATGATAPGRLLVTIVPGSADNSPPEPPVLEGRVVAGDVVKVRVPGTGVDAEGDPVTVTGIVDAPSLGRVVSYGGNFIEYQAYPRTYGTDTLTYALVDSRGAVGIGTARVAVVPPGTPQPPLAVADRMTVEPGRTATFDPLANDFVAPGDDATVELVDPPRGVRLDPETSLVTVQAPAQVDAAAVQVVYRLTNGLDESRTTITLETAADFENPPVVYDAFGRADDSGSVVVDVLEGAYDPDGPAEDLRVTRVYGEPRATIDGGNVRVPRSEVPKVVPFRVEDGEGAAATASLYVPPTGNPMPYVDPDALLELDGGETVDGTLDDLVVVPEGARLRVTGRQAWSTTPADSLAVTPQGQRGFELTAADGYRGPGAVLVEVTTATDPSGNEDVEDATDGFTVTLSIPVRVGDDTPVLECPQTTIPMSAGEVRDLDVDTLCKVFTIDPRDAADLEFTAAWSREVPGLSVTPLGDSLFRVQAADDANAGGDASLQLRAGESNAQEIGFRLATAPPPSMLPIQVDDLRAGESRTIDLAPYLEAGVADPQPTVVSVSQLSPSGVRASASGSRVTLTAPRDAQGAASFRVVMSDVASSDPARQRRAEGRIAFQVRGVPSAPMRPFVTDTYQEGTISLQWGPPRDDGGSPVTGYVVQSVDGSISRTCRTIKCDVRGLRSGKRYSFRVAAVNKVGRGEWSERSVQAMADTAPGRVRNIRMASRGDGVITLAWDKPPTSGSRILDYTILWANGPTVVSGDTTSYPFGGLDNNTEYSFSIIARNAVGSSPARESAPMQSLGTPAAPGQPTLTDLSSGSSDTSVRVSWPATSPEGPGPTSYTLRVSREGAASTTVPGCSRITALTCTHRGIPYDGGSYSYTVTAYNEPGNASPPSVPVGFVAIGKPAAWGSWSVVATGADQQARVEAFAPDPRAKKGTLEVIVGAQVVKRLTVTRGQGINEIVSTPTNNTPSSVRLRLCNEEACSDSDTKSVQTYGPLQGMLQPIGPGSTAAGSRVVTWGYSGSANGKRSQVVARVYEGGGLVREEVHQVGPGTFGLQISATASGYETPLVLTVTLSDPEAPGRGVDEESQTTLSGSPPPPAISLGREQCSDADGSARPCENGEFSDFRCLDPSCAFITVTTSNFRSSPDCTFETRQARTFRKNGLPANGGPTNSSFYFGWKNETVSVTCFTGPFPDFPGGQTVRTQLVW